MASTTTQEPAPTASSPSLTIPPSLAPYFSSSPSSSLTLMGVPAACLFHNTEHRDNDEAENEHRDDSETHNENDNSNSKSTERVSIMKDILATAVLLEELLQQHEQHRRQNPKNNSNKECHHSNDRIRQALTLVLDYQMDGLEQASRKIVDDYRHWQQTAIAHFLKVRPWRQLESNENDSDDEEDNNNPATTRLLRFEFNHANGGCLHQTSIAVPSSTMLQHYQDSLLQEVATWRAVMFGQCGKADTTGNNTRHDENSKKTSSHWREQFSNLLEKQQQQQREQHDCAEAVLGRHLKEFVHALIQAQGDAILIFIRYLLNHDRTTTRRATVNGGATMNANVVDNIEMPRNNVGTVMNVV